MKSETHANQNNSTELNGAFDRQVAALLKLFSPSVGCMDRTPLVLSIAPSDLLCIVLLLVDARGIL